MLLWVEKKSTGMNDSCAEAVSLSQDHPSLAADEEKRVFSEKNVEQIEMLLITLLLFLRIYHGVGWWKSLLIFRAVRVPVKHFKQSIRLFGAMKNEFHLQRCHFVFIFRKLFLTFLHFFIVKWKFNCGFLALLLFLYFPSTISPPSIFQFNSTRTEYPNAPP